MESNENTQENENTQDLKNTEEVKNTEEIKNTQELELNDEKMLSFVIFKNLYPKDFAELEDESASSIVRKAFKNKRDYVANIDKCLEKKKEEKNKLILEVNNESLEQVRELKLALIHSLVNYEHAVYCIRINGMEYTIYNILQDDFDINLLKNSNMNIYWFDNSYGKRQTTLYSDDKVESKIESYLIRIERVIKGINKVREEAHLELEKYENELNKCKTYSIQQLIDKFGVDFLDEEIKANKLLVFLLRHGYIDEDFENYINYFYPNSISKNDMNYILRVRNHSGNNNFATPINNPERVFSKLQNYEFEQVEVLNNDLVDWILSTDDIETRKSKNYLFKKLKDYSYESSEFINQYVNRNKNMEQFFHNICLDNSDFWVTVNLCLNISEDTKFKYLEYILEYADENDVKKILHNKIPDVYSEDTDEDEDEDDKVAILEEYDSISDLLLNNRDSIKKLKNVSLDKLKLLIEELNIKFEDVDLNGVNEDTIAYIINDKHYELNNQMIKRIFELKKSNLVGNLATQNYTSIMQLGYKPLIDYIQDGNYFSEYIEKCVVGIETNTQESIESINDIIKRLPVDKNDLCIKVLEKQNIVWEDITTCFDTDESGVERQEILWKELLKLDKVRPVWTNFLAFYKKYGKTNELVNFFMRNFDQFIDDFKHDIVPEDILKEIMLFDFSKTDFRKYIKTVGINDYSDSIEELNEMKIQILIEEGSLAFSSKLWIEMESIAPNLRMAYARNNKDTFMDSLESIELKDFEIINIIQDEYYSENDKRAVLTKLDINKLDNKMASIIYKLSFDIGRTLCDTVWKLLDSDQRKILLLNQISLYENDELSELFFGLDETYYDLVQKEKRHGFKLDISEYNRELLEKLYDRNYITSFHEDSKIDKFVGYVKGI